MSKDIIIYSQNVGGLGNKYKRRALFRHLNSLQGGIILLQETYCNQTLEKRWLNEWGGQGLL